MRQASWIAMQAILPWSLRSIASAYIPMQVVRKLPTPCGCLIARALLMADIFLCSLVQLSGAFPQVHRLCHPHNRVSVIPLLPLSPPPPPPPPSCPV